MIISDKSHNIDIPLLKETFNSPIDTIPIYEINDIHITPYYTVKELSESIDLDISLTISLLEEVNDIDNIHLLISEVDSLLEDIDYEELPYVINPISENDEEYVYTESCIDNYEQTLDESYIDILTEEGKQSKLQDLVDIGQARKTVLQYLKSVKNVTGSKASSLFGFAGISAKDVDPIVNDLLDMVKSGNFDPSKITSLKDHGKALYNKFTKLVKDNPEKIVRSAKDAYKSYELGKKANEQIQSDDKWEKTKGVVNAARSGFYAHKAAYGKGTIGTLNKMDNEYLHGGGKVGLAAVGGVALLANRKRIAKRIAALRRLYDKKKHSKNIPSKVLWKIKDLINRLMVRLQKMKGSK